MPFLRLLSWRVSQVLVSPRPRADMVPGTLTGKTSEQRLDGRRRHGFEMQSANVSNLSVSISAPVRRGRPKLHEDGAARARAYRRRCKTQKLRNLGTTREKAAAEWNNL